MDPLQSPKSVQDWLDVVNSANLDPNILNNLEDSLHLLEDQDIMYQLGLRLSDPEILEYFAPQLSDTTIFQLLEERNNPEIRLLLTRHIKSPSLRLELFNNQSENEEIRISLISSLFDEKDELSGKLVKLITKERSPQMKGILISYLSPEEDEEILESLVFGEEYVEPRQQAASLIHNQEIIRTILQKEQNGDVRLAAVNNLEDSLMLKKLAVVDLNWKVQMAALQKISTPEILVQAAETDPIMEIRLYCLDQIDDPNVLASIAMNESNSVVRKRAVELIAERKDMDTLMVIALEEKNLEIKILAINQLNNEEILTRIIRSSTISLIKIAAINRLTDIDILIELISELNNLILQKAIITRLTDLGEIITLEFLEAETRGSIQQQIRKALKKLY